MCCAIACLAKLVLFVFNIILLILSLFITTIGVILRFAWVILGPALQAAIEQGIKPMENQSGTKMPVDVNMILDALPMIGTAGLILIFAGLGLFAVAVLGLVAGNFCCVIKPLLYVYMGICGTILSAWVIFGLVLVFSTEQINQQIKDQLKQTIKEHFIEVWQMYTQFDAMGAGWNVAMLGLHCTTFF